MQRIRGLGTPRASGAENAERRIGSAPSRQLRKIRAALFREGTPFCRKQGQNEKSKRLAQPAIPQKKRKIRRRFAAGWVRSSPRKISSPKPTFSLVCARPNPSSQAAQPAPTSRKTPRPQTQYGESKCPPIPRRRAARAMPANCRPAAPPPCKIHGRFRIRKVHRDAINGPAAMQTGRANPRPRAVSAASECQKIR